MKRSIAILLTIVSLACIGCSSDNKPTPSESVTATPANGITAATDSATEVSNDPLQNKGIGPITNLKLDPIDPKLAEAGEKVFKANCTACHKMDKRRVGPALAGVTERRSPEWVMNMIMNPSEMLEKDPIARELLSEYATQMADQNINEADARAILEYLRTKTTPEEM